MSGAPPPGCLDVWIVPLDGPDLHDDAGACTEAERAQAARFRFERDARRSLRARGALRRILAGLVGASPAELEFERACAFCGGPHGKPRLAAPARAADLRFNLAHAEDVALVAVAAGREVGIDVERVRPLEDAPAVGAAVFSPAERAAVERAAPGLRPAAFFAAWTRKEAYLKARGFGLAPPHGEPPAAQVDLGEPGAPRAVASPDGRAWTVQDVEAPEGYAAAACVEGSEPLRVRLRRRST